MGYEGLVYLGADNWAKAEAIEAVVRKGTGSQVILRGNVVVETPLHPSYVVDNIASIVEGN